MTSQFLAISVVLVAVALPIIWFERFVRRTQYNHIQAFFLLVAKLLARVLWRARLVGPVTVPETGGAVLICNHRSSVDPFFIQTVLRRVVRWMVAREYCEHPLFGGFLRAAATIPVNRGGIDTKSTKTAIRTVAEGGAVGMFPEGRINLTDDFMRPVRPGAIVVALKSHAPIIPCYVDGSPYRGTAWSPFLMRANVRVHFGNPIDVSPYYGQERDPEVVRQLLTRCVKAIAELADRPDFEPTLAGRDWKPADSESATHENDD
jgi:1-acyl-sn-glycerol-3-phosphate acyltransferase